MNTIYTTANRIQIGVLPGKKSVNDFIVKYLDPGPGKRLRTPQHVHLIVELYVKQAHDAALTISLRDHLLNVYGRVAPVLAFPPRLQVFTPADVARFRPLDAVGEFSAEFLLVVSELIFIQEKTNYPKGSMTEKLYRAFGAVDRFKVISQATFRGR